MLHILVESEAKKPDSSVLISPERDEIIILIFMLIKKIGFPDPHYITRNINNGLKFYAENIRTLVVYSLRLKVPEKLRSRSRSNLKVKRQGQVSSR